MPDLCLNVRFLLWKKGVARAEWVLKLAALLGWSEEDTESFLTVESSTLSDKELKTLARFGGVADGDLATKDLLATANLDLFYENISFLIDLLPHGEKKRFAEKLGVDATTISRWKNGAQKPTKKKVSAILRYFLLADDIDLEQVPLFLSAAPVGADEMRAWLRMKIAGLSVDALRDLLPAFKKLLAWR